MSTKTTNTKQLGKELFCVLQAIAHHYGESPIIPKRKLERALYGAKHWSKQMYIPVDIPTIRKKLTFTKQGEKGLHCKGIEKLLQGGTEHGSIIQLENNKYRINSNQQTTTITYDQQELVELADYLYKYMTFVKTKS